MTGQSVKPGHYHTRQNVTATVDSLTSEEGGRSRGETKGRIGPAVVGVDSTWITENFSTKFPARSPDAPPLVASSMAVFAALTRDLQNPALDFVPATLSFTSVLGAFLPWMGVKEPGLSVWQLMGRKVLSASMCPPALRGRIDADFPGWFKDPGV